MSRLLSLYSGPASDIMDLDIKGVQGSMEQLKLTEKPQLSQKAKQRLSVKSKKKRLPSSRSPPMTERREGDRKRPLTSRSVSPPVTGGRGGGKNADSVDRGPNTACECTVGAELVYSGDVHGE